MPDDVIEEADAYDVELRARAAMWDQVTKLIGDIRIVSLFVASTLTEIGTDAVKAIKEDLANRKK